MTSLRCHEWDEHQSYRRDRNAPPWIKVHRNLMQNRKWARLTDADKGHLVSIWVLAADRDGHIPNDPYLVKKICMLDEEPDLEKFIELGLLTPERRQGDAKVTSARRQSDAPEAEAEAEADKKSESEPKEKTNTSTAARFDDFWDEYPKKVGRKKCLAKWKSRKLDRMADTLIADVRIRKEKDGKWLEGFIPNPETYINGDRWEDDLDQPKSDDAKEAARRRLFGDDAIEGHATRM